MTSGPIRKFFYSWLAGMACAVVAVLIRRSLLPGSHDEYRSIDNVISTNVWVIALLCVFSLSLKPSIPLLQLTKFYLLAVALGVIVLLTESTLGAVTPAGIAGLVAGGISLLGSGWWCIYLITSVPPQDD